MSSHPVNGTVEEIYEFLVKAAGLYGKAFAHERTTPKEEKKLASLWKLALRTVDARNEKNAQLAEKIAEVKAAKKPTVGMIPGQTPYTDEEMEKLKSMVAEAAADDPGEQNEA